MVPENSINKIIYIIGPTASGKTDLALSLCDKLNGEVIGADSMQIYKYISIGTAKPTSDEIGSNKYHFIDFVEPNEIYTVSQFKDEALNKIDKMHKEGITPIVCGGTGLYVNSLLYQMDFTDASYDLSLRQQLESMTLEQLQEKLYKLDIDTYNSIDKCNPRRVMRAIEICMLSGKTKSSQTNDYKKNLRPYDHRVIILNPAREILYDRINRRVDIMLSNGFENEVRELIKNYPDDSFPIFQFIGYKEMLSYIKGEVDYNTAIENMKRNTRRFAKRQLTWFRGITGIDNLHWIDTAYGKEKLVEQVLKICK